MESFSILALMLEDIELPAIEHALISDLPIVEDEAAQIVKSQVRRRGKALEWKYVKTFENMEAAAEQYTKQKLVEKEMIRGRKSIGKANAYYFNCQKMSCGCKKKWRLLISPASPTVVEEETNDDHCKHEMFARNGGFGMTFVQVQIINEALSRYPMKPLQIFNHFGVLAAEALAVGTQYARNLPCKLTPSNFIRYANTDPMAIVIGAPKIAQIVSFMSFQKKKRISAALQAKVEEESMLSDSTV